MKTSIRPYLLLFALVFSINAFCLPKLNSFPAASATIYLDFDGHYVNSAVWNNGIAFTCAPAGMSDAQITEVFNRVSEDYRPFNINITTDSTVFYAAPLAKRIRVVVTPTSAWYTGVGGVSYVGSFTWGDDTPCFVFCDRLGPNIPKMVAECCSHESGHTVGLSHQSKYDASCTLTATYNDGAGTGQVGWAPIMGNSYYRNMSGWNNGPTPYGCSNIQDNLSIITSQNGFTYRTDDYADDINLNPTKINISNINVDGIITTSTDKDAFQINVPQNINVHFDINPYSVGMNDDGANLDIKVQLFDANKILIRTYDPPASMSVTIDTILNSGSYYMIVDGTGNTNTTDYGSLGSYTIRGASGSLPIQNVTLSGKVVKDKHLLDWSIISTDAIREINVMSSNDGINYHLLTTLSGSNTGYKYTPPTNSDMYYKLKVTSVLGQSLYSNVIFLRGIAKTDLQFMVSRFVHNQVDVAAQVPYQYILSDINGKTLQHGSGNEGMNHINVDALPSGIYVLQLFDNETRYTERIIKQ